MTASTHTTNGKPRGRTKSNIDWPAITRQIIQGLDIIAEYQAMGVEFASDEPRASGKISCHSRARGSADDRKPSAYVNVNTGQYGESTGPDSHKDLSFFQFAAKYGSFTDSKAAFHHFAEKAGVQVNKRKQKDAPSKTPEEQLKFLEWNIGNDRLAKTWCAIRKPGCTVEAIKAFGGRVARYPCGIGENGDWYRGKHMVIALPCYGLNLTNAEPVAWVVWEISGGMFEVYEKGEVVGHVKMKSVGPTYGTLMNTHALAHLALQPDQRKFEAVWKTAGPTDAMALWSAIPPDQRELQLVTTNASGETGDVPEIVARLFEKCMVNVVGDADIAGETGAAKWVSALVRHTAEVRHLKLPYAIEAKKGKDLRHWLTEKTDPPHTFAELQEIERATPAVKADEAILPEPIANYRRVQVGEGENIKTEAEFLPLNYIVNLIRDRLDGWPKKAVGMLFAPYGNYGVYWLQNTGALFGWIKSKTENEVIGNVSWKGGEDAVTKNEFFEYLNSCPDDYVAVESFPHEPPIDGHYYACKSLEPGDGKTVEQLLDRFSPETDVDRWLILAAMLSMMWGGRGGARPLFVVTSDSATGAGKSTLVELAASLFGEAISMSVSEDIDKFKARLLSEEGLGKRVACVDNVKANNLSWADLESLITSRTISGRRNHVGEGRRPNILTWFLTVNGPSFSRDIAKRSVVIKLRGADHTLEWADEINSFIRDNAEQILADLIGYLRRPRNELKEASRWGSWESGVLCRLPDPDSIQAVVLERQAKVDANASEIEMFEEWVDQKLLQLGYPAIDRVRIPKATAAQWLIKATGDKQSERVAATQLARICNERQTKRIQEDPSRTHGRAYIWSCKDCTNTFQPYWNDLPRRLAEHAEAEIKRKAALEEQGKLEARGQIQHEPWQE